MKKFDQQKKTLRNGFKKLNSLKPLITFNCTNTDTSLKVENTKV